MVIRHLSPMSVSGSCDVSAMRIYTHVCNEEGEAAETNLRFPFMLILL